MIMLGGANAALVVLLGAFGAHALKGQLPPDLAAVYQTGIHNHMFHSLGLIAVGLAAARGRASALWNWAGGLMLAGILLFSGSLYVLVVSGIRALGMITPFGGAAFVAGWILFAAAAIRSPGRK